MNKLKQLPSVDAAASWRGAPPVSRCPSMLAVRWLRFPAKNALKGGAIPTAELLQAVRKARS